MKKKLLLFYLILLTANLIFAQGIIFREGTLAESLTEAKQENKLIFVDVYTNWCEPCKLVEMTIFPQKKVGQFYNEHFINYKLNAEKGEGPDIVKKYGIKAYPTFLYLNGDGNMIHSFGGAKDVKGFLEEANKVNTCAQYGGWEKMQSSYKTGNNSSDFLWDYYELVGENKKDEVLNKYLMSLPDKKLITMEVGQMIENIKLYDNELFTRLVEGRVKLGNQEPNFNFIFTFPLQWKLTKLFDESIEKGDRKRFEEIMTLKNKFHVLPNTQDQDIQLIWGRGLFFASPELINLCYYYKNRYTTDQFPSIVVDYMNNLMNKYPLDSLGQKRPELITTIQKIPELAELMINSINEEYNIMASYIIDWTNHYWRLVPSDKVHREQCASWMNYACQMNPYIPENPIKAASLLIRLNHKKDAITYLENAIKAQQAIGGKNIKAIKMLQDELEAVKNGKI